MAILVDSNNLIHEVLKQEYHINKANAETRPGLTPGQITASVRGDFKQMTHILSFTWTDPCDQYFVTF